MRGGVSNHPAFLYVTGCRVMPPFAERDGGIMAQKSETLLIAKGKGDVAILPRMANRHGLIAGATGTGKTITLRVLAEQFSRIGVPVFMADVKGDLSSMGKPGGDRPE